MGWAESREIGCNPYIAKKETKFFFVDERMNFESIEEKKRNPIT